MVKIGFFKARSLIKALLLSILPLNQSFKSLFRRMLCLVKKGLFKARSLIKALLLSVLPLNQSFKSLFCRMLCFRSRVITIIRLFCCHLLPYCFHSFLHPFLHHFRFRFHSMKTSRRFSWNLLEGCGKFDRCSNNRTQTLPPLSVKKQDLFRAVKFLHYSGNQKSGANPIKLFTP